MCSVLSWIFWQNSWRVTLPEIVIQWIRGSRVEGSRRTFPPISHPWSPSRKQIWKPGWSGLHDLSTYLYGYSLARVTRAGRCKLRPINVTSNGMDISVFGLGLGVNWKNKKRSSRTFGLRASVRCRANFFQQLRGDLKLFEGNHQWLNCFWREIHLCFK